MNTNPSSPCRPVRPGRMSVLLACLLMVALLLPGGAGWTAQAAPPAQEAPPDRLPYDGPFDLPRQPGAMPQKEAGQPLLAPEYVDWSRLVFQSARNNSDWEIYAARGDGANQVNISNHGSMDIHPRLNRGATRVVFASNRHGGYDLFTMNADGGGQNRVIDHPGDDVFPTWSPDGSRIAFQSHRDSQPQIYAVNADGSGLARLTYHGDYDGQPAWSPDGSQIAFVRRESGGYRIWAMNADGSNQRQLSNQAYSADPAWSPDGSQIAYDADGNGDGWQEIWLMNADGSNQRQVYDPPEGNTDAWGGSWSPDGRYVAFTRISFVYYQGQWYWTSAYLDAWDSTQSWITIRLSGSGADWNPDWQPIDVQTPSSYVQSLPAESPGPFTVRWSGSDAGGSGVKNYDVQVKDGASGAWSDWKVKVTASSDSYPGLSGHTYYFRSRAHDNAGNTETWPVDHDAMTTVESIPPSSTVLPLPTFSYAWTAKMTWRGRDYGGSSIRTFEIQCRLDGAETWQSCGTYAAPGSAVIPGAVGIPVYIRSRAIDTAGNIEAWPPGDGDTQTTLYNWKATGTVTDNSGTPLAGITVTTEPWSFATITNTDDGRYEAYSGGGGDSMLVAISKNGYGSLPATALQPSSPYTRHVVLDGVIPPVDNLINNWGFEGGLPGSWEIGGSALPAARARSRRTGDFGAELGWPFTPPVNVSNANVILFDAKTDAEGGLRVLWGRGDIYFVRRAPDGSWSEPEMIRATANSAKMATDPNGNTYIVWHESVSGQNDVFFSQRAPNGQWSAKVNVSNSLVANSIDPLVEADSSGVVHVIWTESTTSLPSRIHHRARAVNGTWSATVVISDPDPLPIRLGSPQMVVNPQGEVDVVWTRPDSAGDTSYVLHAHRSVNGTWSPAQVIFSGTRTILAQSATGTLHLLWTSENHIVHASRLPGANWSAPEIVYAPYSPWAVSEHYAMHVDRSGTVHTAVSPLGSCTTSRVCIEYRRRDPALGWSEIETITTSAERVSISLATDVGGAVYAVWMFGNSYPTPGSLKVFISQRSISGGWSIPVELTGNTWQSSWSPLVVVDSLDCAHILWTSQIGGGRSDVFHTRHVGAPPAGASWLRQVVTIPSVMTNPGLSLVYQFHQDNPNDGRSSFSVVLDDGTNISTLFSSSAARTTWTHQWLSLKPWIGRTITITLRLDYAADSLPAVVYLDEVTIGSTYPDIWVSQPAWQAALPGRTFQTTLTYGNRGGVAASGGQVTLQLPAQLSFVSANPPPSATTPTLRWDVGALPAQSGPQTIRVTLQVAASAAGGSTVTTTAGITSSSPELEQANNTAQGSVFIGSVRYMPVIMR